MLFRSKWACSWITSRVGSVADGGHFFVPQHGLKIEAAPNTFIAWRPGQYYGTSLPDTEAPSLGSVGPSSRKTNFIQHSVSFITSSRLPAIWKRYQDNLLTAKAAEDELREGHDDEGREPLIWNAH